MAFLSKLFGKKDKKDESELLDAKVHEEEDEEEGLTEEEIAAAERFEAENAELIANATALDYDGDFIDYGDEEDEESEKDSEEAVAEIAEEAVEEIIEEAVEETVEEELAGDLEIEELEDLADEESEQALEDVEAIYGEADETEEAVEAEEVEETEEIEAVAEEEEIAEAEAEEVVEESAEESAEEFEEEPEEEEEKISFWEKLKNGLAKTKKALFGSVNEMLKSFAKVDEDLLEELEELLIMADVGVAATEEIIEELRDRIQDGRLKEKEQVLDALKEILGDMIGEHQPLKLETTPSVVLVIGVNGAGKTTSIGKISKRLRLSGKKVVVAAADTFRAAAIDQLEVWCQRAKVDIVKQNEGSDPAAVVFDAISYAKRKEADVLIIDTAGRLHNKQNLMNELAKINRVIERELPDASRENLLVLDATTGQNAVIQAKEFSKAANITGITLNKLDGTAKGGIVISIKRELGIPVKFIGVGEKIDDMQEFDAEQFIDALFE